MPILNRRHFLRASDAAISRPILEAMLPAAARAGFASARDVPRRMFCVSLVSFFGSQSLSPALADQLLDAKARDEAKPWQTLFNGHDFSGWKYSDNLKQRWEADDGVIRLRADQPPRKPKVHDLETKETFRDFELIVEWRLIEKPRSQLMKDFTDDGLIKRDDDGSVAMHQVLHAGDSGVILRGDPMAQVNIWSQPMGSGDINPVHKNASLSERIRRACVPSQRADHPPGQWNRFVISMRGNRVTVKLNDKVVIKNAELPGVADEGPIALQNHGDAVEFRNLLLRELP